MLIHEDADADADARLLLCCQVVKSFQKFGQLCYFHSPAASTIEQSSLGGLHCRLFRLLAATGVEDGDLSVKMLRINSNSVFCFWRFSWLGLCFDW